MASVTQPGLHHRLCGRKLAARIDAGDLVCRSLNRGDAAAVGVRQRHNIGEVIFALGVVGPDIAQPARHVGGGSAQHAGITQRLGAFDFRCIDPFDDALHIAVPRDHAAIAAGIGGAKREQRQSGVAGGAAVDQAP